MHYSSSLEWLCWTQVALLMLAWIIVYENKKKQCRLIHWTCFLSGHIGCWKEKKNAIYWIDPKLCFISSWWQNKQITWSTLYVVESLIFGLLWTLHFTIWGLQMFHETWGIWGLRLVRKFLFYLARWSLFHGEERQRATYKLLHWQAPGARQMPNRIIDWNGRDWERWRSFP